MSKTLALAGRMLLRDGRAGELTLLFLALAVAVAAVTSVAFFADRLWSALAREAHQLLGADVLLASDHPWSEVFRAEIARRGLAHTEAILFPSMARSRSEAQLASVEAIAPGYPLRGRIRIAPALGAADAPAAAPPARGTLWLEERLAAALGVNVGDTVLLGDARFAVAAILTDEPGRGVSFFNIAPRLLMRIEDVSATGLIQTGSRVVYRLFAAGTPDAIAGFERWAKSRLGRGERLEDLDNARPELRESLDRGERFLGLAALLAVALAAAAIALAARRYAARHLDAYALLAALGAGRRQRALLFGAEFAALALVASLFGAAIGWAVQAVFAFGFERWFGVSLPAASVSPALQGIALGFVLLGAFAWPPLERLRRVPVLRVLRRELPAPPPRALTIYAIGVLAAFGLLWWQARDPKLAGWVFGGFVAAMAISAALARGALAALAALGRGGALGWRYGLANLARRPAANTVQAVALGTALAAILLLAFVRGDLIASWRRTLPADAPDRFLIGIQPEQIAPLVRFLSENGARSLQTFPIVRARLVAINGRPVSAADYSDEAARRQIEREFNLTYLEHKPADNAIEEGAWFSPRDFAAGAISVERWIADRLGIRLGDRLEFSVGGQNFAAPVTSIRKLDWGTLKPNFFFIATPALVKNLPYSAMAAFVAPADPRFAARLSAAFPNVTAIDVAAILRQFEALSERLIHAVQGLFLFALAAGLLVLYAALAATEGERVQEAAVMRALGASRRQVLSVQRTELLALGAVAGVLAAVAAAAIGEVLARKIFQLDYRPDAWLWIVGPALGLACMLLNLRASARAALRRPPILALREMQ